MSVLNCLPIEKNTIHIANVINGKFKVGDTVIASVNKDRRLSVARNHTATHLLQAALRKVLGEHVQQQGSFVGEERLRFDFTHFKALEKQELDRVEEVVNNFILNNDSLNIETMTLEKAKETGALAFFAEKYDETVRVVKIGNYSKELCAGTHLSNTGEIGLFKIISESAIAQGIRRIEATTGTFAYKLIKQREEVLEGASQVLKSDTANLIPRIDKLSSYVKELEKKMISLKLKSFSSCIDELIKRGEDVQGLKIIVEKVEDADNELLRQMIDLIKNKSGPAVIVLATIQDNKAYLCVGLTDDLVKKGMDAAAILKDIAEIISAKGGGRPHLAQAGGTGIAKLPQALEKAKEIIKGKIKP
jgi:alanyl-tRNA synthetase